MKVEKKVLTPDLKAKLDGYLPIKPVCDIKFTPKVFKENLTENEQPVFNIKTLSTVEIMDCRYNSAGGYRLHVFRKGVKSWSDPAGIIGEFKKDYISQDGTLTDDAICNFSPLLIAEIADFISQNSALTKDEELSL